MPTFFVVTNTERIDGAGVIFYPEFMDNMGELLGNDFFILPSSIHQMLILPDDGQVDAEMLRDMVKEVNATQVAPAERLTNDVYHFDTKDHVFEKADRFTERQKEKEAQVAKTEKVGKEQPDQKPKTKKHDKLLRDTVSDELSVEFGTTNFFDVDVHRHTHHLLNFGLQSFNVSTLLADHDART